MATSHTYHDTVRHGPSPQQQPTAKMGNQASKAPDLTSESIQRHYAALAAEREALDPRVNNTETKNEVQDPQPDSRGSSSPRSAGEVDGPKEEPTSHANDVEPNDPVPGGGGEPQRVQSLSNADAVGALRDTIPTGALEAATIHVLVAMRARKAKVEDAWNIAIAALRKTPVVAVAKAVLNWVRANPWETAVIVVPLVLLVCTPAFLGLAGFTAGGIAAGKPLTDPSRDGQSD